MFSGIVHSFQMIFECICLIWIVWCQTGDWSCAGRTAGSGWMGKQTERASLGNPCNIRLVYVSKVKLNNTLFYSVAEEIASENSDTVYSSTPEVKAWLLQLLRGTWTCETKSSEQWQTAALQRALPPGAKMGSNWWECGGTGWVLSVRELSIQIKTQKTSSRVLLAFWHNCLLSFQRSVQAKIQSLQSQLDSL